MAAKRRSGVRNIDEILKRFQQFTSRVDMEDLNLGSVEADVNTNQFVTEKEEDFDALIKAIDTFKKDMLDAKESFKSRYIMEQIEKNMKSGNAIDQIALLLGSVSKSDKEDVESEVKTESKDAELSEDEQLELLYDTDGKAK